MSKVPHTDLGRVEVRRKKGSKVLAACAGTTAIGRTLKGSQHALLVLVLSHVLCDAYVTGMVNPRSYLRMMVCIMHDVD